MCRVFKVHFKSDIIFGSRGIFLFNNNNSHNNNNLLMTGKTGREICFSLVQRKRNSITSFTFQH